MIPRSVLYARFMKDPVSVRLGGIASDLIRLSGLAKTNPANKPHFQSVLDETKFFTEWTAADLSIDAQEKILELQRVLVQWDGRLISHEQLSSVQQEAKDWSEKVLLASGMVT